MSKPVAIGSDAWGRAEPHIARRRQVGKFRQAFSHLPLILAAREISAAEAPGTAVDAEREAA